MADYRHFCVFDFETGSVDPSSTQILQIGASIIHKNNLEIVDSFTSLAKPKHMDLVEDGALAVNHITREQLEDAPDIDVVFKMWADWILQWNTNRNNNSFGAPIACGWGSDGFDIPIFKRYCEEYGYWDKKYKSPSLLNCFFTFDVMKQFWYWTIPNKDVKNCKLGTAVQYMGLATEQEVEELAHDAMQDVIWTAKIAQKFLRVSRWGNEFNDKTQRKRLPMENCFVRETADV